MSQSIQPGFEIRTPVIPPKWAHEELALEVVLGWESNITIMDHEPKSSVADLRFLILDDVSELVRFHQDIQETESEKYFVSLEMPEFFEANIEKHGRIVGVFLKSGRLVAYGIVTFPRNELENIGELAGLGPAELSRVAHFSSAFVDKNYQGNSIHQIINRLREQCAMLAGYHHVVSAVYTHDLLSLSHQVKNGFRIVNMVSSMNKCDQFILMKSPTLPRHFFDHTQYEIPMSNHEALKKAFQGNAVAHKILETDKGSLNLLCSNL